MTLVALWASASMDEGPAMKFVWHALHAPAVFLPEPSEIYQLAKWNECISSWELFNVYPNCCLESDYWAQGKPAVPVCLFHIDMSSRFGLRSILSRRTLWSPTPNSIMASRAPAMRPRMKGLVFDGPWWAMIQIQPQHKGFYTSQCLSMTRKIWFALKVGRICEAFRLNCGPPPLSVVKSMLANAKLQHGTSIIMSHVLSQSFG